MTPTCQICGRAIKANTGLIAHHGYQRPYQQYHQTASCFGARRVPYEVGHDAIDEYLVLLAAWIADVKTRRDEFRKNPPATLTYQRHDAYLRPVGEALIRERPEGFDPTNFYGSIPRTYENLYMNRAAELANEINSLRRDHKELTARRAAWKAAA